MACARWCWFMAMVAIRPCGGGSKPHLDGVRPILFDESGCGASDMSDVDADRHSRLESCAEDLGGICEALICTTAPWRAIPSAP